MNFLDLKYPILQAPIGGAGSTNLAASVSNAGGLGSLALTWATPDIAVQRIKRLQSQTKQPFFANFVLSFPPKALRDVLEAGTPIITFSWGQPGPLIHQVQTYGALAGVQVGSLQGARQAIDDGANFVICQGVEAGGHVQSTTPLSELLEKIVKISGSVPVIAAGGLSNGKDIAWALKQGASAVMLGTRFVATVESNAHPHYKQALVEGSATDSVYTLCFDGGWPYAAHRVLRNKTLQEWENAGCPQPGHRPGEGDTVAQDKAGNPIKRYDDAPPFVDTVGEVLECCLYAGTGCGKIKDIPEAALLMSDLWTEFQQVKYD